VYLRASKRKNRDGSTVTYYQLAHNARHPETGRSVPQIIHSFGRSDQLDRMQLVRLCGSIARVCGLEVQDRLAEVGDNGEVKEAGLPDGMTLRNTVELGVTHLVEALWERLGIGPAFRKIQESKRCKVPYERALLAMTANRLSEPASKLGVWERWLEHVYLPDCKGLKLRQMYEAMDFFMDHAEVIEEAVFHQVANLFNLDVDVIFFDTTTASFSIDGADEDEVDDDGESVAGLRQFGHSKEGTWTPQVVIALAVTKEGLPVRSWVFPGNTSDSTTIKQVRTDLRGWNLSRTIFVADAGMNTSDNREELSRACGKYVLATRAASIREIRDEVLNRPGRFKEISENLKAKEVIVGGKDDVKRRRYIVCFNPKQAKREGLHREQVITELEAELGSHKDLKATAQWAIRLKASGRYGRYLKITEGGKLEMDRKKIQSAARYDGKWVLQTNDDSLTVQEAAESYKALMVIERCFRQLKQTQIRVMPMHHWLPNRITAHVKICVMALLIERVAERASGLSWARIRDCLRKIQASCFETEDHLFFQRNEPSEKAVKLLRKLEVSLPKRILAVQAV
jgi:hypothetical protein